MSAAAVTTPWNEDLGGVGGVDREGEDGPGRMGEDGDGDRGVETRGGAAAK